MASYWALWLHCYKRTFEGVEDIWERIKFWVVIWLLDVKEFNIVSFSVLMKGREHFS